ncbi:TSUP family transporter [Thalassotalea agariperforans]
MADLSVIQYLLIALVFVWSGFVRSGLGFGGAVLSLPFLLLIDNQPLVYLPLIAVHLLIFSSATVVTRYIKQQKMSAGEAQQAQTSINWPYLKYAFSIIIIPKLIGVFGLLTLPTTVMSTIIFAIVSCYAITYILNKPFTSNKPWLDVLFLMLGGYISGTSLIGAPLIIAVIANHVNKYQLRDTLFVLWFVLVTIKMSMFVYLGIDLQLIHHLWLLPAATVGHFIGLHFHQRLLAGEQAKFYRLLGCVLLLISGIGLYQLF